MKSDASIHAALVQYRIGDMYSPKVQQTEALALGVEEFICSIQENRLPLTNGKDGLDIIKIMEAADKSIKNKGEVMELKSSSYAY
jgi:predicted dehydrogenase